MLFSSLLSLFLTLSQLHQSTYVRASQESVEGNFRGIPKFAELASDEKREVYYYEQTIIVRDSGPNDKVRSCEVIEVYQEQIAKEVLQNLTSLLNLIPQQVNMDKILNLTKDCDSVDDNFVANYKLRRYFVMYPEEVPETHGPNPLFNGIYPGTKWCGTGDIAENYHDLHGIRGVDRCCRAHDLCPIKVLSEEPRYNITNSAKYTKSHCLCDEGFYDCLKKDNGWAAKIIGNLYFYVASPDCIKGLPEFPEEKMHFVNATRQW